MPTEIFHRLVVQGPSKALEAFRCDAGLWTRTPWSEMYGLDVDDSNPGRLIYRYADDYKRPSPSVEAMARSHPDLRFTLDYADQFLQSGGRITYVQGRRRKAESSRPLACNWSEWDDG